MNFKKISLTISILFLVFFLILAIPAAKFQLGNLTIEIPQIDSSLIKQGTSFGNFQRSQGLFATNQIVTFPFFEDEISAEEKKVAVEEATKVYRNRLSFVGMNDVEVYSVEDAGPAYRIVFNYPQYYKNPNKYTGWLTQKGKIEFFNSDQVTKLSVSDSDVTGDIAINFNTGLQYPIKQDSTITSSTSLKFEFKESTLGEILVSIQPTSDGRRGMLMFIDDNAKLYLDQTEVDANTTKLVAIPAVSEFDSPLEVNIFLNIIRSLFLERRELAFSSVTAEAQGEVNAEYSVDGTRFTAIMTAIGVLGIIAFITFRERARKGITFTLMLLSQLSFVIVFLKFRNAPLSIGTLLGLILIILLSALTIREIVRTPDELVVNKILTRNVYIYFMLLIVSMVLPILITSLGIFYDTVGVILVGSAAMILMNWFNFKALHQITVKE